MDSLPWLQVQHLQEKLADAAEKLRKLETERWEVLEVRP